MLEKKRLDMKRNDFLSKLHDHYVSIGRKGGSVTGETKKTKPIEHYKKMVILREHKKGNTLQCCGKLKCKKCFGTGYRIRKEGEK